MKLEKPLLLLSHQAASLRFVRQRHRDEIPQKRFDVFGSFLQFVAQHFRKIRADQHAFEKGIGEKLVAQLFRAFFGPFLTDAKENIRPPSAPIRIPPISFGCPTGAGLR